MFLQCVISVVQLHHITETDTKCQFLIEKLQDTMVWIYLHHCNYSWLSHFVIISHYSHVDLHCCCWGSFQKRAAWRGCSAEFCSSPAAPYPPSDPAMALPLPANSKKHICGRRLLSTGIQKHMFCRSRLTQVVIRCTLPPSPHHLLQSEVIRGCLKVAASVSHQMCSQLHEAVVCAQRVARDCLCLCACTVCCPPLNLPQPNHPAESSRERHSAKQQERGL